MKPTGKPTSALLAAGLCLVCVSAHGELRTWEGRGSGDTNDWFNASNWSGGVPPAAGDAVTVNTPKAQVVLTNATPLLASFTIGANSSANTATLTLTNWTTALRAESVTIQAYGTVTCAGPFTNAPAMSNRVWIVCSNLTLSANGKIDVNKKGYAAYNGPGAIASGNFWGGSHGGVGGNITGVAPYGSDEYPDTPGSGGAGNGSAGGAVRIDADGQVTINGTVSADGVYSSRGTTYGSGSGGSVWITCRTLAGTGGVVTANGGPVGGSDQSGSGGGGRIAVHYHPVAQDALPPPGIVFQALGGRRDNTFNRIGGLGTLYFTDHRLLASPFRHSGQWMVPGLSDWTSDVLVITNAGLRFPTAGFTLTVSNSLILAGDHYGLYGLTLDGGSVFCGGDCVVRGSTLALPRSETRRPEVSVGGDLLLTNATASSLTGGQIAIVAGPTNEAAAWGGHVDVGGLLHLTRFSSIQAVSHPTNAGSVLFTVGALTLDAGGTMTARACGFAPYNGPGAKGTFDSHWGAAHGGRGGNNPVAPYGCSNAPALPGSGGAGGGYGGGVVAVRARKAITINGDIDAGGIYSSANIFGGDKYGSGAGGSIYLHCRTFSGTNGSVRAHGGGVVVGHTDTSGAAGGGRIAVWRRYDTATEGLVTNVTALAGTRGRGTNPAGEDGTVVWGWLPATGTLMLMR